MSCRSKKVYPRAKAAAHAAARIRFVFGKEMKIYQCPICDLWHLSRVKGGGKR